jgi:hypothetical protein
MVAGYRSVAFWLAEKGTGDGKRLIDSNCSKDTFSIDSPDLADFEPSLSNSIFVPVGIVLEVRVTTNVDFCVFSVMSNYRLLFTRQCFNDLENLIGCGIGRMTKFDVSVAQTIC